VRSKVAGCRRPYAFQHDVQNPVTGKQQGRAEFFLDVRLLRAVTLEKFLHNREFSNSSPSLAIRVLILRLAIGVLHPEAP
jgi:hypothetical protein